MPISKIITGFSWATMMGWPPEVMFSSAIVSGSEAQGAAGLGVEERVVEIEDNGADHAARLIWWTARWFSPG